MSHLLHQLLEQRMSSSPLFHPFISLLLTIISCYIIIKWIFFITKASKKNLPPSPSKLPIIGHLHKLGLLPHRSLQDLSQKHGPLMLLHLGSVPTLVVSSAKAAQQLMKTHDLAFADRPKSKINQKLLYDYKDISVAPYGEYWRQIKSVCVLQLLSNKKVNGLSKLRETETSLLMKKMAESSSSVVDLSDLFMTLTNDIVSLSAFGRKISEGESGRKVKKMMKEFVGVLGGFDVGTYIPSLAWISSISGLYARVDRIGKEIDEFLEGLVEEHIQKQENFGDHTEDGTEDFVHLLLGIYKDKTSAGFSMDRDSIKAILIDIAAGGTDTTYTVLEWAMTELLREPRAMEQVQNELRNIAKGKSYMFQQGDLEKMHYLKAVIKETLRLHPPIPLLIPRSAREDVKFMGYDIAAGTMIITNAYAIGRDPESWDEPEEFRPERFLNCSIDFRGHDFQLLPFGAGRRGCPGISFAMATNEFVLANILHKFDWKLPEGMKGEDLDMTECTGLTIHRKVPLLAVATPHFT